MRLKNFLCIVRKENPLRLDVSNVKISLLFKIDENTFIKINITHIYEQNEHFSTLEIVYIINIMSNLEIFKTLGSLPFINIPFFFSFC